MQTINNFDPCTLFVRGTDSFKLKIIFNIGPNEVIFKELALEKIDFFRINSTVKCKLMKFNPITKTKISLAGNIEYVRGTCNSGSIINLGGIDVPDDFDVHFDVDADFYSED